MPSNDDANESGDRLDRFLIAGPTPPPRGLVGLDAFLAEPPLPPEPPAPPAARTTQAVVDPHDPPTTAEAPTIEPHRFTDDAAEAAVPPALASFQAEDVPSWAVADAFDEADPAPIAPPSFAPPDDLRQAAAAVPGFAAEAERSRGDDIASALAAHPLDDQMLADPSALLSASPPSNPTVVAPSGSARFDPWSSDGSPPIQPQPPAPSRFGRSSLAAGPMGAGSGETWARADDRPSFDSDALERLEGRLSRAVTQLEDAVASLSGPGPRPLGSRPRGFKGRIDA